MDAHVRVGSLEKAVLEPVGLTDAEDVSGSLEVGDIGGLVRGVGDHEHDVDDRLRRKPGHGC